MGVLSDPVHAEHLPGQIETGNLFDTLAIDRKALDRTTAHRINGSEGFAGVVDVFAPAQRATPFDDIVEQVDFPDLERHGQAKGVHSAVAAVGLRSLGAVDFHLRHRLLLRGILPRSRCFINPPRSVLLAQLRVQKTHEGQVSGSRRRQVPVVANRFQPSKLLEGRYYLRTTI